VSTPPPSNPEMHTVEEPPNGCLYTVSQAAKILSLPITWIYERTRRDAIPYRKLGKYIRFTISDLEAILAACSRGPRIEVKQDSNGEQF
jgi:excisionase family DNA binding protein